MVKPTKKILEARIKRFQKRSPSPDDTYVNRDFFQALYNLYRNPDAAFHTHAEDLCWIW